MRNILLLSALGISGLVITRLVPSEGVERIESETASQAFLRTLGQPFFEQAEALPAQSPLAENQSDISSQDEEFVQLASEIDNEFFSGWFSANNVAYSDIVALWKIESSLNPRAFNLKGRDGEQGGAWGLGQVTARTAQDYGVNLFPVRMLSASFGGRVSMQHIQFTINGLKRGLNRAPTANEWVAAYNTGVTGFLNGNQQTAGREDAFNRARA